MASERSEDEAQIRGVRQRWAFARDHGEWDAMRACFHPEATVCVSWFSGPASVFFERTIALSAQRRPEERSKHWFGNSRIWQTGDRAILEIDTMVLGRNWFEGHLFDFTWYMRMYDRIERRAGEWRILRMTAIYDKDRLDPVVPGSVPASFFAGLKLEGQEAGVAMMRFMNEKRARPIPPDMVLGGSEGERSLRADAQSWLAAG